MLFRPIPSFSFVLFPLPYCSYRGALQLRRLMTEGRFILSLYWATTSHTRLRGVSSSRRSITPTWRQMVTSVSTRWRGIGRRKWPSRMFCRCDTLETACLCEVNCLALLVLLRCRLGVCSVVLVITRGSYIGMWLVGSHDKLAATATLGRTDTLGCTDPRLVRPGNFHCSHDSLMRKESGISSPLSRKIRPWVTSAPPPCLVPLNIVLCLSGVHCGYPVCFFRDTNFTKTPE